jgi:chemotaxis protein CheX
MDIGECEIHDVVRNIWETVLGWGIEPTAALTLPHGNREFLTGFVFIAGAWQGAVVCTSSDALVRHAAAVMFGIPQDTLTIELLHDALGELTNMIGGNVKALLPGPSYLCLPAVVEGSDNAVCVDGTEPIVELAFLSQGQPFTVKLLGAGAPPKLPRREQSDRCVGS